MYQIFIIICIILICLYVYKSKPNEHFNPFDSNFNYESCKKLINEQKKVNLLTKTYCNKDISNNNRTNINLNETCYENTTRQILLDKETNNWCSKLSEADKKKIEDEVLKDINIVDIEGIKYMEQQYIRQKDIMPINNDVLYSEVN